MSNRFQAQRATVHCFSLSIIQKIEKLLSHTHQISILLLLCLSHFASIMHTFAILHFFYSSLPSFFSFFFSFLRFIFINSSLTSIFEAFSEYVECRYMQIKSHHDVQIQMLNAILACINVACCTVHTVQLWKSVA